MVSGLQYQDIEKRSYMIWMQEGCPHGHDLEHWLQAERELAEETMMPPKAAAKKTATPRKRKAPAKKPTMAN